MFFLLCFSSENVFWGDFVFFWMFCPLFFGFGLRENVFFGFFGGTCCVCVFFLVDLFFAGFFWLGLFGEMLFSFFFVVVLIIYIFFLPQRGHRLFLKKS